MRRGSTHRGTCGIEHLRVRQVGGRVFFVGGHAKPPPPAPHRRVLSCGLPEWPRPALHAVQEGPS